MHLDGSEVQSAVGAIEGHLIDAETTRAARLHDRRQLLCFDSYGKSYYDENEPVREGHLFVIVTFYITKATSPQKRFVKDKMFD